MEVFANVCERKGVPIEHEKTEGPITIIEYLGLTTDNGKMLIKIPIDKIVELKLKLLFALNKKKFTLKELQSLADSLAICTRLLTAGRTFSRRIYVVMVKVHKSFNFIKVTNALKCDLFVWIQFLDNFNGITYIHKINWITNIDFQLFTDSARGKQRVVVHISQGNEQCYNGSITGKMKYLGTSLI